MVALQSEEDYCTDTLTAISKLARRLAAADKAAAGTAGGSSSGGGVAAVKARTAAAGGSSDTVQAAGSSACAASAPTPGFLTLTCSASGRDIRACRCEHHHPGKLRKVIGAAGAAFVSAKMAGLVNAPVFNDVVAEAGRLLRYSPEGEASDRPRGALAGEGRSPQEIHHQEQQAIELDQRVEYLLLQLQMTTSMTRMADQLLLGRPLEAAGLAAVQRMMASREVRRLQVLVLERLVMHSGGDGGGGGSSSSTSSGSSSGSTSSSTASSSLQQWWLTRFEVESGRVVNSSFDEKAGVAMEPAAWAEPARQGSLESAHMNWVDKSLVLWARMAEEPGAQPPPLALVLRLANRTAAALLRLSSSGDAGGSRCAEENRGGPGSGPEPGPGLGLGLGLGGATYGPQPRFHSAQLVSGGCGAGWAVGAVCSNPN